STRETTSPSLERGSIAFESTTPMTYPGVHSASVMAFESTARWAAACSLSCMKYALIRYLGMVRAPPVTERFCVRSSSTVPSGATRCQEKVVHFLALANAAVGIVRLTQPGHTRSRTSCTFGKVVYSQVDGGTDGEFACDGYIDRSSAP